MASYILRRIVYMVFVLWLVSAVSFILIQLPPGDYITEYISQLEATGEAVDQAMIAS